MTKRNAMNVSRSMIRNFCVLGLLLVSLSTLAQPLVWKDAPDETFVFKLSDKEALKLLKGRFRPKDWDRVLATPFTSFSEKWEEPPAEGHFIFANIERNKINYSYHPVIPFQVFLFKEYGALTLQVVDAEGDIRNDAKVRLDYKRLSYDNSSQTYSYEDWSEEEDHILTVELDKFRAVFDLKKHLVPSWYSDYWDREESRPSFYSYMITDKNKYKPGETVRFKSYALSGNRRPLKQELSLWMRTKGYQFKKILTLPPYHPGGFAGEFQLDDSLKLELDRLYSIQLRDKRGRVAATTNFRYEDYELTGSKLEAKLHSDVQYASQVNKLEVVATDANGLPMQEMEVEITVRLRTILHSYISVLSLPDTLMFRRVSLDATGKTHLEIPADIFGPSDCAYEVNVLLLTPDNERREQRCRATFYHSHYELQYHTRGDSLRFAFLDKGVERSVEAELICGNDKKIRKIHLPYEQKFSQAATGYLLRVPAFNYESRIAVADMNSQLDLKGEIDSDSLKACLTNPLNLDVSWYVYQGNQLLQKGAGKELDLHIGDIDTRAVYYIEVFYFMGNEERSLKRVYRVYPNSLSVETNLPKRIYPGQRVDATLHVRDRYGEPVPNVDLTAFSVNSQLGYDIPDLPYYGAEPQAREQRASYSMKQKNYLHSAPLDFEHWNRLAHLDRLPYYRFIYPSGQLFRHVMDTPDGSTQFAPYVMMGGKSVTIYVIELNDKPCYFSWTKQPQGYSFRIPSESSKQKMTIRLSDRAIVLDSISFEKGKKTILSLDMEQVPEEAKTVWLKTIRDRQGRTVFSRKEEERYQSYLCRLPVPDGVEYTCLEGEFGKMCPVYLNYALPRMKSVLVGPVEPGYWKYANGVEYRHEGGFAYEFEGNVVYKYSEELCPKYLSFSSTDVITNLNDFYFTPEVFRQFVEKCRQRNAWHPQNICIAQSDKALNLRLPVEKDSTGVAGLLFEDRITRKVSYPDMIVKNGNRNLEIPTGVYNIIVLYNNGKYLKRDSIELRPCHHVDINMEMSVWHERDSLSSQWLALQRHLGTFSLKPAYRELRLTKTRWAGRDKVSGYVYIEGDDEPLTGVSVVEKGTGNGAVTDIDGYFELMCERGGNSTLEFSFIGMQTKEVEVRPNTELIIMMKEDNLALDEVVVTGYGTRVRSALAGSVSGLLTTTTRSGADAIPPEEELPDEEAKTSEEAEHRLYDELMQLNGLRRNFSDVGFWEPKLYTDKEGKAQFNVTFPDNITKWDAVVYAMNRKLNSGTYRQSIQSYKPLMAELKTPRFLTVGDTTNFTGTIRNYTKEEEVKGSTVFCVEADTLMRQEVRLKGTYSIGLPVQVTTSDSMKVSYIFTRDDGYRDGEEHMIPVVAQGTELSKGSLCVLQKDETVKVKAGPGEEVRVELSGSQLDSYQDAVNYLGRYRYWCNEQLASKLIGLLGQKKIAYYNGERFAGEKEIIKIIRRLVNNQNDEQLWGWWGRTTESSLWMSGHILKALKMAMEDGYEVRINLDKLRVRYELAQPFRGKRLEDIYLLHALWYWGAEQDYAAIFRLLNPLVEQCEVKENALKEADKSYLPQSCLKEKLLLWEMLQSQVSVADSIRRYLKEDALGGVYCTDDRRLSYCDYTGLENTLIAYRIIKSEPSLSHLKEAMQWHILRTRNTGWNTYQASLAVATVLDDLLDGQSQQGVPAIVELTGKENRQITEFPYTIRLAAGDSLVLTRKEGIPLILSSSIVKRVTEANGSDAFEVQSVFEGGDRLKAGEPATLVVTLNVKQAGAEYVMLEVPIPASCSYNSKINSNISEVHREYFKEKTVIFCEKLPVGKHLFRISLLPRYTGTYSLNPAKVELMYFPVVNANNEIRNIQVTERRTE